MKYDGIETKALLKQSADRLLYICIAGAVLEGIGYLLYVKSHSPYLSFVAIFIFISVNVLCVFFIRNMYFPRRLREVYEREDVPDEQVNWPWYDRVEHFLLVSMVAFPNTDFIFNLATRL